MKMELRLERRKRIEPKGIESLIFEFEAPVIIAPTDAKTAGSLYSVPDWLLARIRSERLERRGNEELATPSELVAYLMTARDYFQLDMEMMHVYETYFSDIIRRMNNPGVRTDGYILNSKEQKLADELRKWIYKNQVESLI
jgi:hypothetical protein